MKRVCLQSLWQPGLNMFVLCYKIKWAKERSNRESRGFVTEGVDGRMAEYIQTNTQGLHGSVVHATVKEYLKILNYLNYSIIQLSGTNLNYSNLFIRHKFTCQAPSIYDANLYAY